MPNKMLIDATHPEETRVVVLRGNRVEEFDFESANRKQLRGNIYLAKVTRVEPSLQAAFVDYGGNRHGFLAFSEIHPDYYQIPVADRQALIAEEERAQRAADDEPIIAPAADAAEAVIATAAPTAIATCAAVSRWATRRLPPKKPRARSLKFSRTRSCRKERRRSSRSRLPPKQRPPPVDADAPNEAREAYESPAGDVVLPAEHVAERSRSWRRSRSV